ncbi:flavin monoamine oxidase family protein [Aspergillus foveolatus]|uniref:flavin monoamine oxidase family protein n=1 Tax=Aspergillus foveolatus TaxID=210207 RepID=UPI003CCD3AAA
MSRRPNVAIIGAGFAGLRCADILIQNGAQVTVFEARDRVGGRVCSRGPNWIHGAGANPVLDIARAMRTTLHDFEGSQLVFRSDGKTLDERLAMKISEALWTIIDEAFTYSNNHEADIPAEKSLLDFIRERLQETSLTEDEKRLCIDAARLWGCYIGDAIERQSLKFFSLEESIDGSNYFVASTYKDILAQVSSTALQHADIHLNQPIVNIHSKPIIQGTSTRREVTVTTQAGERHAFDEVVVTCPLGWLKRNKEAFTPELPPRLSSAIDAISYGRLEKVYITFPEAFWHTETTGNTVALPTTSAAAANGTNTKLSFAQFLNPLYHTDHPEEVPWDQECFSLAALPKDTAHPTLLFYTYGPCATYIVDKLTSLSSTTTEMTDSNTHAPSSKQYTFLNTLFAPFYSLLPNYIPNTKACTPTSILATTWQSDPNAGHGSYSNFQVGLVDGNKDIETLRAGMGLDRGVWFAGEHTAPFVALGTTTGALWSGERAAGQICALYRLGRVGMGVERDDSLPSGNGNGSARVFSEGANGKGGSGFRVGGGSGNGTGSATGVRNGGEGGGRDALLS